MYLREYRFDTKDLDSPEIVTLITIRKIIDISTKTKKHQSLICKLRIISFFDISIMGRVQFCYLIALGSGKALRSMRQLSGDGAISEQRVFSGSLWYGTPHTW